MNNGGGMDQAPPDLGRCDKSRPGVGAAPFVWCVWVGMFLLALSYVGKFGSRFPYYDDWELVPLLTGDQPLTPASLWAQHNEHRVPLPKLALYALTKLSGFDFRIGMFFSVALLGGLSFAMLLAIRRVRGRLLFPDAFFPLVVLGLGQWESFLIGFALNLVSSTVVAGVFLLLLVVGGPQVSARAAGMGVCLAVLPLLGASGLALVPALALWLAFVGALHCRAPDAASRRQGWLVLGLVAAALLLTALYFIGFQRPNGAPPQPSATLERGLEVLSLLFGRLELDWRWRAAVVPIALLGTGVAWGAAWRRPREPVIQLGFLAFLLGMGCLVGAVAWGRADLSGLAPRYATLVAPLGCCLYFLWERYGGVRGARAAQTALFLLAAMALLPNCKDAFHAGGVRRIAGDHFAADFASHMPPGILAERDGGRMYMADGKDCLADWVRMLRNARVGDFRWLREDVSLRAVALPPSATSLRDMVWAGGAARPVGDDPSLTFTLPQAELVYAVRLHYVYKNGVNRPDLFEASWQNGAGDASARGRTGCVILEAGDGDDREERTATIWVNDRIDSFRLVPRTKLFALRLSAVELLLPDGGPPDSAAGP